MRRGAERSASWLAVVVAAVSWGCQAPSTTAARVPEDGSSPLARLYVAGESVRYVMTGSHRSPQGERLYTAESEGRVTRSDDGAFFEEAALSVLVTLRVRNCPDLWCDRRRKGGGRREWSPAGQRACRHRGPLAASWSLFPGTTMVAHTYCFETGSAQAGRVTRRSARTIAGQGLSAADRRRHACNLMVKQFNGRCKKPRSRWSNGVPSQNFVA